MQFSIFFLFLFILLSLKSLETFLISSLSLSLSLSLLFILSLYSPSRDLSSKLEAPNLKLHSLLRIINSHLLTLSIASELHGCIINALRDNLELPPKPQLAWHTLHLIVIGSHLVYIASYSNKRHSIYLSSNSSSTSLHKNKERMSRIV